MTAYDNVHYRLKVTRGRAAEHACIGCNQKISGHEGYENV